MSYSGKNIGLEIIEHLKEREVNNCDHIASNILNNHPVLFTVNEFWRFNKEQHVFSIVQSQNFISQTIAMSENGQIPYLLKASVEGHDGSMGLYKIVIKLLHSVPVAKNEPSWEKGKGATSSIWNLVSVFHSTFLFILSSWENDFLEISVRLNITFTAEREDFKKTSVSWMIWWFRCGTGHFPPCLLI